MDKSKVIDSIFRSLTGDSRPKTKEHKELCTALFCMDWAALLALQSLARKASAQKNRRAAQSGGVVAFVEAF